MASFDRWQDFYLILGSAAGALIGLQFVVMTLVAERPTQGAEEAGNAFSTPNVFHFATCLWLSLLAAVPWAYPSLVPWIYAVSGGFGLTYSLIVAWRMGHQVGYRPKAIDWVTYVAAPMLLYLLLLGAAVALAWRPADGLLLIGAAAAGLLFTGVYNSWDGVAFLVARRAEEEGETFRPGPGARSVGDEQRDG